MVYSIVVAPPIKGDYAEIVLFGDLHYGTPSQDRKAIQDLIEYVLDTPDCFAVSVGDILDLSIKSHFGEIGRDEAVSDALRNFKDDFKPLINEGRFLGAVPGNHDVRIAKSLGSGLDVVEEWFYDLNADGYKDAFGFEIGYGCPHLIVKSKVGRSVFVGFITHGSGGGQTVGAVANSALKSDNELSDADWYAQGHFHIPVEIPQLQRPYFDRKSNTVQVQNKLYISTGAFQKKEGYAAVGRFKAAGCTSTILELYASPESNHTQPKSIQSRLFRSFNEEMQQRKLKGIEHDRYRSS